MHHKHNKSSAKAVGHDITNMVTHNDVDAQLQADAMVYAIQEVANAMQQQQDKKFNQIMQLFQTMLKMQGNHTGTNNENPSNASADQKSQHPKCKHCNCQHKKVESECWELEANKDKCPKGYKMKAEKVKQDS